MIVTVRHISPGTLTAPNQFEDAYSASVFLLSKHDMFMRLGYIHSDTKVIGNTAYLLYSKGDEWAELQVNVKDA